MINILLNKKNKITDTTKALHRNFNFPSAERRPADSPTSSPSGLGRCSSPLSYENAHRVAWIWHRDHRLTCPEDLRHRLYCFLECAHPPLMPHTHTVHIQYMGLYFTAI